MATPESRVKATVKRVLKEFGAYQFWPVQTGMGAPTLDCLGCWNGKFFAIETKAPGKKPTSRQLITMDAIAAAKGRNLIIDTADYASVKAVIDYLLRQTA